MLHLSKTTRGSANSKYGIERPDPDLTLRLRTPIFDPNLLLFHGCNLLLFHGWNVEYLPDETMSPQDNVKNGKMALPPCHLRYQFYVANNKLSLMMTIRSNDLFLGCPFNIAQAALWVHVLAQQCDLDLGELTVSIGDAHIYLNHLEQVDTQLSRQSTDLPKLVIKTKPESIYAYQFDY